MLARLDGRTSNTRSMTVLKGNGCRVYWKDMTLECDQRSLASPGALESSTALYH